MKGKIIVIEGTDGSGKATQAKILKERLEKEGKQVILFSFPNYESDSSFGVKMYLQGKICENADQLDAYQTSVLFAIDRMITMQKQLKPFYDAGGVIVLDRYVGSNQIHQGGKIADLDERNKYLDWLEDLEYGKMKLPRPDQVIFLDMPIEFSKKMANQRKDLKNGGTRDIQEENKNHLINAYNCAKYLYQLYDWDRIDCIKNNAIKSIEDISEEIYRKIKI